MEKAPDAFRTISEVAAWLETPAHVLRFWESRFPQIKPVKRAGGRRYYRREDMALLGGIKFLLHEQGLTIRGVQKILSEQGVRHVAALSVATPGAQQETAIEGAAAPDTTPETAPDTAPQPAHPADTPQRSRTRDEDEPAQAGQAAPHPPEPAAGQTPTATSETPPRTPAPTEAAQPREPTTSPAPGETPAHATPPEAPPAVQSEFALDGDQPADTPPLQEGGVTERDATQQAALIAARLRAGARIAGDDLEKARALAARLASLRARMADRRPAAPCPR
jgi:DNA-binding transcriptional MerR regulator